MPYRLAVVLCLQLLLTPAATAQTPDLPALDSLIATTVLEHHLVGVSVGVAVNGEVVLARGYGRRALETGAPVTPETLFRIGSVSKQFTCAALLQLAADRKLSLRDPVMNYFPQLTRAREITLADLGGHTAGYRDYYPLDYVDQRMTVARSPDSIIAEYGGMPLDFEPGTRYSYSNTGFLILGRVLEKIAGMPYEQLIARRILTPLHLDHTRFEPSPSSRELASGYTAFALDEPRLAVPEGRGWLGAAGGLWSTPTDLLTWDLALIDGQVLPPTSWQVLTTPRRLPDGRSTGYSCGLGVRDHGSALVLSHSGAVSGYVAWNVMIPATRSAAVVLANMDFAAIGPITEALLKALLPPPPVPAVAGDSPTEAARALLTELRSGQVDRSRLAPAFDQYLTGERLADARHALAGLGPTGQIELLDQWERGGLAVSSLRMQLGSTPVNALLYRRPDGTIEEFLPFWP
jgi:D-alanyl-D-alanine carboxypeptidase